MMEWYQEVDLTRVDEIIFDVRLGMRNTAAYFAVDGQTLWTSSTGEHHDVSVDVTEFSSTYEIAVGILVLQDFDGTGAADGFTWWDNLRVNGPVASDTRTWGAVKALY